MTHVEVVLFDVDETLYPRNAGLMQAIGQRIQVYMEERLGMPPELVNRLRPEYAKMYGTSLRGLQINDQVDSEDYLAFVHDLPLANFIGPNPALAAMLRDLAVRKVIFTNASAEHAQSVARILGIDQYFERIIDVRTFDFICKPHLEMYQRAIDLLQIEPDHCLLVDDNVRNLRPGKQLGMLTVMVGDHTPEEGVVDFHLPDVLGVGEIVKQLNAG
jgi:putative hydrolase of the HAD superfamily